MAEDGKMSRQEFSLAYNGEGRKHNHSIDVETLAPALLAFGKLLREANVEFNGKKSQTKILVTSDFEHKCFQINFELAVTIYEQMKLLLGSSPVQTAKELLEWVGLLKPAVAVGAPTITYLAYLKWKNGRKTESITEVKDQSEAGTVIVKVEGNNNSINVDSRIVNLGQNPKALKSVRDALDPIGVDGFDTLELKDGDIQLDKVSISDAEKILASCNSGLQEIGEIEPEVEVSSAWLNVYSPVYDADQSRWRFNLGREHVYVDISETDIAEEALARGGALIEDSYQVSLEITTPIDKDGKKGKPTYKALKVLKFIAADPIYRQGDMLVAPNENDKDKK